VVVGLVEFRLYGLQTVLIGYAIRPDRENSKICPTFTLYQAVHDHLSRDEDEAEAEHVPVPAQTTTSVSVVLSIRV